MLSIGVATLAGFVLGLFCTWYVLLAALPLVVIVAAFYLQLHGAGIGETVLIAFAANVVFQLAFVAGNAISFLRGAASSGFRMLR